MTIPDWLAPLSGREDVRWHPPAREETIAAVAGYYPAPLPDTLLQFWRTSDGLDLVAFQGVVLSATAVLALLEKKHWPPVKLGLLPVLDDTQSGYIALHVTGAIAPRLSYLPNDDGPNLLYRDLSSFFRALPEAMASGEQADGYYRSPLLGDYAPDAPRTAADQATAELLIQTGEEAQLIRAVALLDTSRIDIWAQLLESQHFVRREVRARLKHLKEPPFVELAARDAAAFEQFVDFATRAAQSAGLTVDRRNGDALRANGQWYNLDHLFHRRNIPDAFAKLTAWFTDRAAEREPPPGGYLR